MLQISYGDGIPPLLIIYAGIHAQAAAASHAKLQQT